MKKSLFLGILPAIFALSACNGAMQPVEQENKNTFMEDTLAHEEIFGNSEMEARGLAPRRMLDLGSRLEDPIDHPAGNELSIGVQSLSEQTGYISFRFVAAVQFGEGELDPTEAKWRRTVSESDGDAVKAKNYIPCEKAYKKLSNGGSAYSITDFNKDHGTSYTHFVVYTLRNVPVDVNNYFVSAYLNLSSKEQGGKTLISKAIAINADQSQKYTYANDLGTAFMELTHNETTTVVESETARDSQSSNKFAKSGLALTKNDSYVIKEFFDTELFVKGSDCIKGNNNPSGYYFSNDGSGAIKTNFSGRYNIFINSSDELWINASNVVRPIYLNLESWWFEANCSVALYAYDSANTSNGLWFTWNSHQQYLMSNSEVDPASYNTIKVVRVGNNKSPSLDSPEYGNCSKTLSFPSCPSYNENEQKIQDCVYVYGGSDPRDISWGARN